MFGRWVGTLAALLLAINPVHIWLSQDARMYSLLVMLAIANMLVFWQALHTKQRRYWLALLILNIAIFNLHYFGLWLPVIQFIIILSNFGRYLTRFRWWVAVQFGAGLFLLPWLYMLSTREAQTFGIGFLNKPNLWDLPLTLWNFALGISATAVMPLVAIALLLYGVAVLYALRRGDRKVRQGQIVLFVWVFVPLVLVWIISQRRSFYADRYLSFIIPGFLLLVIFGISRIKQPLMQNLLSLGLVLGSFYGLITTYADPVFFKDDWRGTIQHIQKNEEPGDVILLYTTHIRFPFSYYYDGPSTIEPLSLNLQQFPIEQLTDNHQRAWVIYPYTRRPTPLPYATPSAPRVLGRRLGAQSFAGRVA